MKKVRDGRELFLIDLEGFWAGRLADVVFLVGFLCGWSWCGGLSIVEV